MIEAKKLGILNREIEETPQYLKLENNCGKETEQF
jgi:hypothetical protein